MAVDPPDPVGTFFDDVSSSEQSLLVLNRMSPEPVVTLLEGAFEDQSVTVADRVVPNGAEDIVCLVEDGHVVATTPLAQLEESFLLVNVDRYRSGTRGLQSESFPDVLTALSDTEFRVRGFPKSDREKLLLVLISRYIEYRALRSGSGRLRATFQKLSRLDDELGTQRVYSWLAESDVDTHVYGIDDDPETVHDIDVTVHTGRDEPYRRSWLVVFRPPAGRDGGAALAAIETGNNVWQGVWTHDAGRIGRIETYLEERF